MKYVDKWSHHMLLGGTFSAVMLLVLCNLICKCQDVPIRLQVSFL